MSRKSQICSLNLTPGLTEAAEPTAISRTVVAECPTRKRLAKAAARLRNIDLVRNHRKDPGYAKSLEESIVWRELLELELQQARETYPDPRRDT